jgi:colanic acid biosynthesis glycosyl transferase WcaI
MKILLYGLNFAPEQTGIGKYTGEMATWLSDAGHEVRVVTAPPYYPQWAVGAGYSAWGGVVENHGDVKVWRTPVWVPAKPTGLARIVHLASFAVMSLPTMLKQVWWKPDAVVVVAPAFACAPGGWLTARLSGAKAWLHIPLLRGRLDAATIRPRVDDFPADDGSALREERHECPRRVVSELGRRERDHAEQVTEPVS